MSIEVKISTGAKLLDLYCGGGGATAGYMAAGFVVTGVDIDKQPNYPGANFIQADVLSLDYEQLLSFDVIHASPPCQAYSVASAVSRKRGKVYPDLVSATRQLLVAAGKPYVIENVPPAPVRPDICLDGTMFDELSRLLRKRIFETNISGLKRYPRPSSAEIFSDEYVTVAGENGYGDEWPGWVAAMGIDWMNRNQMREAIPPAYTRWIGQQIMSSSNSLKPVAAAIDAKNPRLKSVPGDKLPRQLSFFMSNVANMSGRNS